jgi:hypothetical protein
MRLLLVLAVVAAGAWLLIDRDVVESPLREDAPADNRGGSRGREQPALRPARCPADVAGCRSVTGRIVFVERVDPDGDGDLHVVVADGSISLPGVTAVDVRPGLRPRRDPRVGDRATAAGPVQTGSYGQSQIHALRFRVQRMRAG